MLWLILSVFWLIFPLLLPKHAALINSISSSSFVLFCFVFCFCFCFLNILIKLLCSAKVISLLLDIQTGLWFAITCAVKTSKDNMSDVVFLDFRDFKLTREGNCICGVNAGY